MVIEAPNGSFTILSPSKLPGRGFAIQGTEVGEGSASSTSSADLWSFTLLTRRSGGYPHLLSTTEGPYEIGLFSVMTGGLPLPPASLRHLRSRLLVVGRASLGRAKLFRAKLRRAIEGHTASQSPHHGRRSPARKLLEERLLVFFHLLITL